MKQRIVLIAAGVASATVAVVGVAALHSAQASCVFAAPVNTDLPPLLKSIGGFDQPLDPGNTVNLQQNAQTAATAVDPDLIGSTPGSLVLEAAASSDQPSAIVIPLLRGPVGRAPQVVGLVGYFQDCAGRAYFYKVADQSYSPTATYPVTARASAGKALGSDGLTLYFTGDPFKPSWRTNPRTGSIGRSTPAT